MDFVINILTAFGLSAAISFILYWIIQEYIVSKGNENEILGFYEKDLKSYKKLETFFRERKLVQKPILFTFIGGILGAVAYIIGFMIIYGFIFYIQQKPTEVPDDSVFSIKAYIIGLIFIIPRVQQYLKVKELFKHYEKIQGNKNQ